MRESRLAPTQWVDRHGDALFRYASLFAFGRTEAEDLVQETLAAALQGVGRFQGESTERTWLIGILRHKIADHIRRKSRGRAESAPAELPFNKRGKWQRIPSARGARRLEQMEGPEFWDALGRCLGGLPPPMAHAFCLREVEGMSSDEVCEILGITATNLWTQLHRARLLLRDCLEKNWSGSKGRGRS